MIFSGERKQVTVAAFMKYMIQKSWQKTVLKKVRAHDQ